MATRIVRYSGPAGALPSDVSHEQEVDCDQYIGPATSLVAAGLMLPEQIPEKSMATFYAGFRVRRGERPGRDERYLQVIRSGAQLLVRRGISGEERKRRRAAMEAKWDSRAELPDALARVSGFG